MNKKSFKTFTLVELLVVIAVIGLLITLLLPSLQNSRLASRTALSMSNLKQIHYATISYATNNNSWLFDHSTNWHPAAGINGSTGNRNSVMDWQRMSYEAIIGKVLSRTEASKQMALNTPYFDTSFCPVLRESRPTPTSISPFGDSDYSMNRHFLTHRNLQRLVGQKEPIYTGGTPANDNPAVAGDDFRRSTFNPTNEKHPAFQYINKKAVGLFIDGNIKLFTKSKGAEIHPAVMNHHDFQ